MKFPFDWHQIEKELKDHIEDKMEYYHNKGIDQSSAEELAIKDMGDPKEIGIALNKEHNPILGWLYAITTFLLVLNLTFAALSWSGVLVSTVFSGNPIDDIPKDNIVYNIEVNEKVEIDDRVIKFKNIVYEKNGDMNIIYEYYNRSLFGRDWALDNVGIGTVKDNLGNEYSHWPSTSSWTRTRRQSLITNKVRTIENFPEKADSIIFEYDLYNRYFRVEVPLKAGDFNE